MATTVRNNVHARDGKGRFRRSVETVDRDAQAAEMHAQGYTYSHIAATLGYADKSAAYRSVQRALAETVDREGVREARNRQLAEMALLRTRMWGVVDSPPPLTDRLGHIVYGEDGEPVPDESARANAAQVLVRLLEREARVRGTDAPRRTQTDIRALIASIPPEDIRRYIEDRKREILGQAQALGGEDAAEWHAAALAALEAGDGEAGADAS